MLLPYEKLQDQISDAITQANGSLSVQQISQKIIKELLFTKVGFDMFSQLTIISN
jgi:hypothetical protein